MSDNVVAVPFDALLAGAPVVLTEEQQTRRRRLTALDVLVKAVIGEAGYMDGLSVVTLTDELPTIVPDEVLGQALKQFPRTGLLVCDPLWVHHAEHSPVDTVETVILADVGTLWRWTTWVRNSSADERRGAPVGKRALVATETSIYPLVGFQALLREHYGSRMFEAIVRRIRRITEQTHERATTETAEPLALAQRTAAMFGIDTDAPTSM